MLHYYLVIITLNKGLCYTVTQYIKGNTILYILRFCHFRGKSGCTQAYCNHFNFFVLLRALNINEYKLAVNTHLFGKVENFISLPLYTQCLEIWKTFQVYHITTTPTIIIKKVFLYLLVILIPSYK